MSSPTTSKSRFSYGVLGNGGIASAEQGERWLYCYVDESYANY